MPPWREGISSLKSLIKHFIQQWLSKTFLIKIKGDQIFLKHGVGWLFPDKEIVFFIFDMSLFFFFVPSLLHQLSLFNPLHSGFCLDHSNYISPFLPGSSSLDQDKIWSYCDFSSQQPKSSNCCCGNVYRLFPVAAAHTRGTTGTARTHSLLASPSLTSLTESKKKNSLSSTVRGGKMLTSFIQGGNGID